MYIPIPEKIASLLKEIGELSHKKNFKAYLVGGPARDIVLSMLKKKNLMINIKDIDIMIEGDAIAIASEYAERKRLRITVHPEFLTAKVWGNLLIDFASSRKETYPYPGSLPSVSPGRFEEDIKRRDFTINAMAISILPDQFGKLIDTTGGLDDLEKGILRILYDKSFQDDPTRILRGIRFSARFGFPFEEKTEKYLKRDKIFLKSISKERIYRELEYIAAEGVNGLLLLKEYGLDKILNISVPDKDFLKRIEVFSEKTKIGQKRSLLSSLFLEDSEYPLPTSIKKNIRLIKEMDGFDIRKVAKIDEDFLPLLYAVIKSEDLFKFLKVRDSISPSISGKELIELGIPPGPEMGKILEDIMVLRWEGKIKNKEDEIKYIKECKNA